MLSWFLQLLGVSREITDHLEHASLAFQRRGVLWLGLMLLFPLGYYIWRRQQTHLITAPPRLRAVLTACRVAILALLVLVLSSPYVKLDHKYEKRPIVAVLVDHSQSMNLPAGPFETEAATVAAAQAAGFAASGGQVPAETRKALNQITRAKLAHTVLDGVKDTFSRPVAQKFDLRFYSVGESLAPLGSGRTAAAASPPTATSVPPARSAESTPPLSAPADFALGEPPNPGQKRSELGAAVVALLEEAAGRPIAGIVLVSDGQNTGTTSLSQAAIAAGRAGAPLFPLTPGSTGRFQDVGIVDVYTSGLVSKDDTASVSVTIESQGFDGRPVKLELFEGEKVLDSEPLTLRGSEQQQLELSFEAKDPGPHYLTVRIAPLAEEVIRENNSDIAFLRVTDEKLKVFYVDGVPRWDFRFIKNAMRRDHGLEPTVLVETELVRRAPGTGDQLPTTADDWARYRTVILGDVSRDTLGATRCDSLAEAVRDRGLGLIVEAGPNHMPHAYLDTELAELLPVQLRRGAGYEAAAYNAFHMELTPEGAAHEPLRLYDEPGRNANIWTRMPGYFWCAAVARPAAGATVLATNPTIESRYGKLPLVAYHHAGKGKVMFVGTDSTWLWRQNVGDRFFYKFWGQTIRFVARTEETDKPQNRLEVRPLRPQPGETTEVELFAYTAEGAPRTEERVRVSLAGPGEPETLTLDADLVTAGRFVGHFVPKVEGSYTIRYDSGDSREPVQAEVRVVTAPEELRRPNIDRAGLEILANATGGQFLELGDLAKLPDKLKGEPQLVEIHREESIWDNWFVLVLLVLIYAVDVGIRRLVGLS